jgi:hypothetical protein
MEQVQEQVQSPEAKKTRYGLLSRCSSGKALQKAIDSVVWVLDAPGRRVPIRPGDRDVGLGALPEDLDFLGVSGVVQGHQLHVPFLGAHLVRLLRATHVTPPASRT